MSHEDDAIVPGERIGPFRLGAGESEVLAFLSREGGVQREQREGTQVVHAGDLSFWFDDGRLTQVGAHSNFGGKLAEKVGVGSTLEDLAELGTIGVDLDDGVLLLEEFDGVCFDVGDGLPELMNAVPEEFVEGESGYQLDANWSISWIGVFDADRMAEVEG